MFEDAFAKLDYLDNIKKREFKNAHQLGKKECIHCGECCYRRPCVPTPEELVIISGYLHLSLKDAVKKYFVVDKYTYFQNAFIFPAKVSQLDICGQVVTTTRGYDVGYCVFYDDLIRICRIEEVKPLDAREYGCWIWANMSQEEQRVWAKRTDDSWASEQSLFVSKYGIDKASLIELHPWNVKQK